MRKQLLISQHSMMLHHADELAAIQKRNPKLHIKTAAQIAYPEFVQLLRSTKVFISPLGCACRTGILSLCLHPGPLTAWALLYLTLSGTDQPIGCDVHGHREYSNIQYRSKSTKFLNYYHVRRHGEYSGKDYEAIISRTLLIKPLARHLQSYPDIYDVNVTCVEVRDPLISASHCNVLGFHRAT